MDLKSFDSDFDQYRKNRLRFQNKELPSESASYENAALRELELVEAKEVRDQQLTREVHEFFSTATAQAAGIVERMAHDAEEQADIKIGQEMESFLMDAFERMNSLVMAVVKDCHSDTAETRLEPKVANLVGHLLDEFRCEGTADLPDKHLGQDPFATNLDDVRRDFEARTSEMNPDLVDDDGSVAIEAVDMEMEGVVDEDEAPDTEDSMAQIAPAAPETAAPEAERESDQVDIQDVEAVLAERHGPEEVPEPLPAPEPEPAPAPEPAPEAQAKETATPDLASAKDELERFKEALKTLVRQGTMSREEARAAWVTRLQSLGVTRLT